MSNSLGSHSPVRKRAQSRAWRLCQAAVIAALSAGSVVAVAQVAPPPTADTTTPIEEVVVTGTHIKQVGLVATSPTTVVTAEDIKVSGKTDINDLLLQLPQNFDNELGQDLGNRTSALTTAGGVATADLRGLGPNRTLVLVDGVRLGIGSPNTFIQSPAPDLDQIPAFLVDRVDVVTGGASATYGSDAIAGVINFVMKKDFQGIQVDGQVGMDQHSNSNKTIDPLLQTFGGTGSYPQGSTLDGQNRQFDIVMGSNFADGKGNVTAYLGFYDTDPVSGAQRDWDACTLAETFDAAGDVTGRACSGSSNSNYVKSLSGPNPTKTYSVFGTSLVPRGSVVTNPPAAFNSQPYIYLTRGDTRYTAGFLAHDDISEYFKPYAQFYFTDDRTKQAIAPDAIFVGDNVLDPAGGGYYYTNCSNPLLSAQQAGLICTPAQIAADAANPGSSLAQLDLRRRNVEGGGRVSYYDHSSYRALVGAKGDFATAWSYDAYAQYYYVNMYQSNPGYFNLQSVNNALQVTGTKANPVCISGGTCVPYNIWTTGAITQQQLDYLYLIGTSEGSYQMHTLHAEVSGDLGQYGIKLPTARDGLGVAFGVEHRGEQQSYQPDSAEESGLMLGAGAAAVPIDVSDHVLEEFAEVRLPLVQDIPFVKDLNIDTAIRRSDYSTSGKVETHKIELQYAPSDDIRFRATFEKAIRAPSLIELFNPQNVGLNALPGGDPCAPDEISGKASATLAQCLNTVPAAARAALTAAYGNGGTTDVIPQVVEDQGYQQQGGNPALKPEVGKTWTAGFSFTPTFIPGLTGTIDYFHLLLTNEVGVSGVNSVLQGCLDNGDTSDCSQVIRNFNNFSFNGTSAATGGYIVQTNQNVGKAVFAGIDITTNYKLPLPMGLGSFVLALNGTFTQHNGSGLSSGTQTDCAGDYGPLCSTVSPRWKHTLRLSYVTPLDVTPSLTWRYIGKVLADNNDPNFDYGIYGAPLFVESTIPAYSYLDFAITYSPIKNLELRGGVNNILDKDPPLAFGDAAGGYNTYSTYDQVGRQVFMAFTAKF